MSSPTLLELCLCVCMNVMPDHFSAFIFSTPTSHLLTINCHYLVATSFSSHIIFYLKQLHPLSCLMSSHHLSLPNPFSLLHLTHVALHCRECNSPTREHLRHSNCRHVHYAVKRNLSHVSYPVLSYRILYSTVLSYRILFYATLFILHSFLLHRIAPHYQY